MTPNSSKTQFNLEQAITYDPLIVSSESLLTEVLVLMSAKQTSCTLTENTITSDSLLPGKISNSCVLVVDDHVLVGIFTEQNLVRLSAEKKSLIGVRIGEVMASSVITLHKSQFNSVFVALNLLQQHHIRYLPLVDDEQVIGLITYESLRTLLRPVELLKLSLIGEVMTKNVIYAPPTASLFFIIELMAKYDVSSVVIATGREQDTEENHNLSPTNSPLLIPIGMITERDVVQFHTLKLDLEQVQAQVVMSRRIFTLTAQNSLWSARLLMEQKQISHIVVTGNKGELQGILSQNTLLQLLNPTEIYKQVKFLTTKINRLEQEKLELLERRNAELEAAVQQRTDEKLFRTTFEQAAVGMSHTALDGQFLLVNQSYCQILGYSEAELLSLNYQSITHPEDLAADVEAVKKLLTGEIQTMNREKRYIRKDGTVVWGHLTVTLLRSSTGKPKHFIVVLQDITDRKIAEASLKALNQKLETRVEQRTLALQQSEQRFLTLFTAAPDFIYLLDMNGIILEVNRAVLEKSGYSENELVGQQNISFYSLPSQQLIRDRIPILLAQGTDEKEVEFISKDGSIHILNCSASIVYDIENQPEYILLLQKDITHQKQSDEALQKTLKELSDFKYAMDQAAIVAITNSQGIITYVNENFCRISGYSQAELIGNTHRLINSNYHPPQFFTNLWSTISSGQVWRGEICNLTKTGGYYWVYSTIVPFLDEQGHPLQYLAIRADITQRKRMEDDLRQRNEQLAIANDKLETATRSKDEFLANMSHELRTPLNAILGMAEAIQDHIFGEINLQQRRAIETIERSGKNLLALINDILDLTKITSGKLELHLTPVSVFYLCQSSITLVRQQAIQKRLELSLTVPEGLADIYVDQRYMCQVLINLLSNAIKFTPEGGNIRLEVKLEPAWPQVNQTTAILFSVMDTGIGIAPENIHKLFQSFVQIDTKLNRQYSGTGLGLALVKQITELHGGSISVESTLGQGSCFTVKLSYQPAPQQLLTDENQIQTINKNQYSRTISDPKKVAADALILLVEDNEANISTVSDYLISRGYRLLVARSGTKAITLAQTQKPQLILMDIQMPGMDGLEASRQIRADKSLENIPIIALTALAMPGDREQCIQAGINEYLSKPVRLKQLVDTIQSFLDK